MPEILLNCQNLQCPEPVMRVKRLLESDPPAHLIVIVDNEAAFENVSRFLRSHNYDIRHEQEPGLWRILAHTGSQDAGMADTAAPHPVFSSPNPLADKKTLVLIPSPAIGTGDDELGAKLMRNFLATLPEMADLWRIILLNGGVSLATAQSPAVEELRKLEAAGISILVCGSCLEHFGLIQKKIVGETTNMLDVVTSLAMAEKVIRV